ncbi:MAG: hypothetical protein J6U49_02610 [Alistipes sp.]|nr:hypothetical protein [Alistipes sp.]
MNEKTITDAQLGLVALTSTINNLLASYEEEYKGIEFGYTAFVDHESGKPSIRLTAKLNEDYAHRD